MNRARRPSSRFFADVSNDPMSAARKLLGYLKQPTGDAASAEEFIDAARVLVFLKGNDAHDYKFSSAVLEDYYHVSPEWRDMYLAVERVQAPQLGRPRQQARRTNARAGFASLRSKVRVFS